MNRKEIFESNIEVFNKDKNQSKFAKFLKSKYPREFGSFEAARQFVKNYVKDKQEYETTTIPLTNDELDIIKEYRSKHEALELECIEKGIPKDEVKHYWFKSEHFSLFVGNKTKPFDLFEKEIYAYIDSKKIKYPDLKYPKFKDANLLVINPADIHIGKLASEFETNDPHNNDLIIKRVKEGVFGILQKTKGFEIDKILFIIGNDILHVDNAKRTTTSGTPQDTDGMWFTNFLLAQRLYIEIIETLVQVASLHIQFDSSNHDYTNGFFLAQTISAWFKNSKNITFNVGIQHRKYFTYGKNLIGTTHGDGAKETDLPLLMAQEASETWHTSKHRYFYISHIHHKKSKDYGSVCVESFRSPSGTDSWHHRNGYQHAPKAIEAFIHHKEQGQIARITNIF
jgi:hypothetical protein